MHKTTDDPSEYLHSLPAEIRTDMQKLDAEISKIMMEQPRTMWAGTFWGGSQQQIIGYGDYTYQRSDGQKGNWFIIGLALQKNYISIYVNAADGKQYLTETYKDKLGKVKMGKSSISFKTIDDINLDKLLELITKAKVMMAH